MKPFATLFISLLLLLPVTGVLAATEGLAFLETGAVRVLYDRSSRSAAERIASLSPPLYRELEASTGLKVDFRPTVIPVVRREDFYRLGGDRAIVAFALPERQQVVINLARFKHRPAALRSVLKHEYVHLLLHHYIPGGRLPRWLDEGIAQHLSDGLSEYLPGQRQMLLGEALAADRVMPLAALAERFPGDDFGRQLAYEQSRSIIGYMVKLYGDGVVADLLARLAAGWSAGESVRAVSGISLQRLEAGWRQRQTSSLAWMGRMAGHIYGILFFLAAVVTLLGFLRHQRRRRNYVDDEDDLGGESG
jgi:hypothetical protein